MKIKELNIVEFGCLKDVRLTLEEGLNVIGGSNESGKSTVMLFIKFMLYGIPKRSAKNADRERCLSFDGHRAAGSMTLECDGVEYRIERRAVGTGRVNETLNFVCQRTAESLSGEPGEVLLGVPVDVFESSSFIGQMRAADISRAQAASAIENMMVSADESIDVKKALERIDKIRKEYRPLRGDGGILNRNESEIAVLKTKRQTATEKHLRYNEMKERLERKERELCEAESALSAAERRLELVRCAQLLERFDKNDRTKEELVRRKEELERLDEEFGAFTPSVAHGTALLSAIETYEASVEKREQRSAQYNAALTSVGVDEKLASLGERLDGLGGASEIIRLARRHNGAGRGRVALGVMSILATAILGGLAVIFSLPIKMFLILASVAFAVGASFFITFGVRALKKRDSVCAEYETTYAELEETLRKCVDEFRKRERIQNEIVSSRARYEDSVENERQCAEKLGRLVGLTCPTANGYDAKDIASAARRELERVERFCRKREEKIKEVYTLGALVENDDKYLSEYDKEELMERVGDETVGTDAKSVAEAEREVNFCKSKQRSFYPDIPNLRESLAGLRAGLGDDPTEIGDRIAELEKKNERDVEYFEALVLAKESIERASASMSGNFTPEISRRAGELLSKISKGRHEALQTTKAFDISVEEDGFSVSADTVSGGTRDAAYISLRIALMLRLFGEDLPPLLLDESLCQFDDERAEAMLDTLASLSQIGLQTVLFTCHTREEAMCQKKGYGANILRLDTQ